MKYLSKKLISNNLGISTEIVVRLLLINHNYLIILLTFKQNEKHKF